MDLLLVFFILLLSVMRSMKEYKVHQYLLDTRYQIKVSDNRVFFSQKKKVYFQENAVFHPIKKFSDLPTFHGNLMNKSCLTISPSCDLQYLIQVITMKLFLLKIQNFLDFSVHKSNLSLPDASQSLSAAFIWKSQFGKKERVVVERQGQQSQRLFNLPT